MELVKKILTAIEYKNNSVHVHFPPDSKNLVEKIQKEFYGGKPVKIERVNKRSGENRKIIFSHKRALGDGLMFTSGIRDFKLLFPEIEINVDSSQPMLWENNPYINRELKKDDPEVEYYKVCYTMVGNANNTAMHFSTMFLFDMIAIADLHEELSLPLGEFCAAFANGNVGDKSLSQEKNKEHGAKEPFLSLGKKYRTFCKEFVRQRGDIHLSEEEKQITLRNRGLA